MFVWRGLVMHRREALLVALAEAQQRGIALLQRLAFGNRAEDVVFDEAARALHSAFLISFGRRSKLDDEC